jgi:glycosyltransferase involved in cell wall biosynthesis
VVPQLRAIVRSVKPDIIQTHNSKSHLLVRLTGLGKQVPWIAFFHGFTAIGPKDRFYNRIGWWALRGAPQIVTVCRAFADGLAQSGVPQSRISVRHNIVAPFVPPPPDQVAALRGRLGILPMQRVALTVGRLSKEKGHADLIDAIALLFGGRDRAETRFVIVGDGPERSALERRAKEKRIGGCVLFTGHQDAVQTYYALADAFILPSHSEGSPNALLEAMAAGLPIVCTAAGGAGELVADGNTALVVDPRSPEAMSRVIGRILDDREFAARLGAAAHRAAREYTPAAYAAAVVGIYRSALRGILNE